MQVHPIVMLAVATCVTLLSPCASSCLAEEKEDGFESLFDGETLTGWDGNPKLWSVVDGAITGITTDAAPLTANEFLIWKGEVSDFVLRLQFRVADKGAGNSGIQYRSKRFPDAGKWVVGGYQADIDRTNQYMGILYEERGRGILALPGEDVKLTSKPKGFTKEVVGTLGTRDELFGDLKPGEWHDYEVSARGNHLMHIINGRTIVNIVDEDSAKSSSQGILALQIHVGGAMQIQFRKIRLQDLSGTE